MPAVRTMPGPRKTTFTPPGLGHDCTEARTRSLMAHDLCADLPHQGHAEADSMVGDGDEGF